MLAPLALLAGCGTPAKLKPLKGMGDVPVAQGADKRATPVQLMTPSTQARPDRQADLLSRSEERQDDPFDLPPGRDNGRSAGTAADRAAPDAGNR
jgi:hypothetical protein